MPRTLDYARPTLDAPPRWLALVSNVTLAYPLAVLGCLYGQWLLSWALLGHLPRPSMDDPKFIHGANWIHPITGLISVGLFPMAVGALFFNVFYVQDHRLELRAPMRLLIMLSLWGGAILLLMWDPLHVAEWWID